MFCHSVSCCGVSRVDLRTRQKHPCNVEISGLSSDMDFATACLIVILPFPKEHSRSSTYVLIPLKMIFDEKGRGARNEKGLAEYVSLTVSNLC